MAIYDVDAINEQELAASRDDIHDNMLEACDQMLCALDESKARRRYVETLNKQADKHDENAGKYNSIAYDFSKLHNGQKAHEYYEKADEERWDSEKLRQKAANYGSKSGKDIYLGKKAEQNFKKDFDAYPAKNEREPGIYKSIQDKKRSIKETCLTILSVLDEI